MLVEGHAARRLVQPRALAMRAGHGARLQGLHDLGNKIHDLDADDWRNREKWDDYQVAVCDMIDRTSSSHAPWTIIEAEDKNFARIKILKTLCDRIEAGMKG